MFECFGVNNQQGRIFLLLFILALLVVLPNTLIFSIDEMATYMSGRPFYGLGASQAGDGRYSFATLCWVFDRIGLGYSSFAVLSVVSFAFGLAAIYAALLRTAQAALTPAAIIGFGAFLTFGMSLDQMQFVGDYMSYAGAMLAVGAIGLLASSQAKPLGVLALGAILFAFGLGFYQSILQITGYFILAVAALQIARGSLWKPVAARGALMAGCAVFGSVIYVAVNETLKHAGAAWYLNYPVRTLGLSYVAVNLRPYLLTIAQSIGFAGHPYASLEPGVVVLLIFAMIVFYLRRSAGLGISGLVIALALVLAALCIFPDPANLLLALYWPSPRSMCAFGLFVGAIMYIICRDRAGMMLALILVAAQIAVVVKNQGERFEQWAADTAVAQQLILDADQNSSAGTTPTITLGVSWRNLAIDVPQPYNYGLSMFGAAWSAPAFVRYIGGGKVSVAVDDGKACTKVQKNLSITPVSNGIIACFAQN